MNRNDGSINSVNNPTWSNRYEVRDYGLYKGVIRDILYTDDDRNNSGGGKQNEVLYSVMAVGGDRDGQLFDNARVLRGLGGFDNWEEINLKSTEGISRLDPASIAAIGDPSINRIDKLGGDVVYFQFLNGDIHMPVIVGMGKHQSDDQTESAEDEGPKYAKRYNGIKTTISKDGEFAWTKDNGLWVPIFPNINDPLMPFINQFAPLVGQEEAVSITLGNKYDFKFEYLLGLNVTIDGLTDEIAFNTTAGAAYTLSGLKDSFVVGTTVGTGLEVSGLTDSISLTTAVGAAVSIDGLSDEISLSTTGGASVTISTASGISVEDVLGDSLELATGAVTLKNATGAKLAFDQAGFIKLGNNTGDALQILGELLQTLSTETAAGFGAPLTSVALYAQLLIKLKLITG